MILYPTRYLNRNLYGKFKIDYHIIIKLFTSNSIDQNYIQCIQKLLEIYENYEAEEKRQILNSYINNETKLNKKVKEIFKKVIDPDRKRRRAVRLKNLKALLLLQQSQAATQKRKTLPH